ncbi:MAG: ATP-dependent helicase C-terminal domain-containing protein, partial [Pontixanthobacter sp.]
RASQAAAAQRAGRAARQGPGVAYRLWEKAGHNGRPKFDPPEVEIADLAPLVLALAHWGTSDPGSLAWLDEPPPASIQAAKARLTKLGALDANGAITPQGRQIAKLPMHPEMAAAVLFGAQAGQATVAAKLALLSQERGLGGRGEDMQQRLARWDADNSPRSKVSRKLAQRWAAKAQTLVSCVDVEQINPALFLAMAMPDNVARRRDRAGENWISAGGRGYFLDPASSLARSEWLVVADAQGQAKGARITAAMALDLGEIEVRLGNLIEKRRTLRWNEKEARAEARIESRMGAITIASGPDPQPDAVAVSALLLEVAHSTLDRLLPPDLLARIRFAGIETLSLDSLRETAQLWLAPLLTGHRDLNLPEGKLRDAVLNQLDWNDRKRLDQAAPRDFTSPAGSTHSIDYVGDGAPSTEVRVQALFGLDVHPMIGSTPLLLQLTSPAGRPIQATRDLPGFWRGSWHDVAKEMKGRYPRHRWPDQPWTEKPSLKTKNAFSRGAS